jgi:hypothetical protein
VGTIGYWATVLAYVDIRSVVLGLMGVLIQVLSSANVRIEDVVVRESDGHCLYVNSGEAHVFRSRFTGCDSSAARFNSPRSESELRDSTLSYSSNGLTLSGM